MSTLTINGKGGDEGDTVKHYGFADQVHVDSVGNKECYHECGTSSTLEAKAGKVVIESVGNVFNLKKAEGAATDGNAPTFENKGGNVLEAAAGTLGPTEQKTDVYNINDYDQLCSFRDATNSSMTFEGITVNLNCDIALPKAWTPISNYSRHSNNDDSVSKCAFAGIFDGKNHTIKGLTNVGLSLNEYIHGRNKSTPDSGEEVMYGFFASVNGATVKNITFADVNITNDAFGSFIGDSVAACVGFSMGSATTIDNVTVNGSIEGFDGVAGILGRDQGSKITVINCTNNAKVWAYEGASGIVGRAYATNVEVKITNCVNNGAVTSDHKNYQSEGVTMKDISDYDKCMACGIVGVRNTTNVVLTECKNTGKIAYRTLNDISNLSDAYKDFHTSEKEQHHSDLLGSSFSSVSKALSGAQIVNCEKGGSLVEIAMDDTETIVSCIHN